MSIACLSTCPSHVYRMSKHTSMSIACLNICLWLSHVQLCVACTGHVRCIHGARSCIYVACMMHTFCAYFAWLVMHGGQLHEKANPLSKAASLDELTSVVVDKALFDSLQTYTSPFHLCSHRASTSLSRNFALLVGRLVGRRRRRRRRRRRLRQKLVSRSAALQVGPVRHG